MADRRDDNLAHLKEAGIDRHTMTEAFFYFLRDRDELARSRFACRLSRRALRKYRTVHLRTPDEKSSHRLDSLMWEYPMGSFLPHAVVGTPYHESCRILIGHEPVEAIRDAVIMNLTEDIPSDWQRFDRIVEIVIKQEEERATLLRERYEEFNSPITEYRLDDWEPSESTSSADGEAEHTQT